MNEEVLEVIEMITHQQIVLLLTRRTLPNLIIPFVLKRSATIVEYTKYHLAMIEVMKESGNEINSDFCSYIGEWMCNRTND